MYIWIIHCHFKERFIVLVICCIPCIHMHSKRPTKHIGMCNSLCFFPWYADHVWSLLQFVVWFLRMCPPLGSFYFIFTFFFQIPAGLMGFLTSFILSSSVYKLQTPPPHHSLLFFVMKFHHHSIFCRFWQAFLMWLTELTGEIANSARKMNCRW